MHTAGELSLIEAIRKRLPPAGPRVHLAIGDDAAVVHGRPVSVTSMDAVIEGVHFELGKGRFSHSDVGFKALASALSDLAAMGVEPGEAYLTLGVPSGTAQADALAVADGAVELAADAGVSLVGGDVVSSPVLSVCVTVVGWCESASVPIYRSGAAVGDIVGVTGALGGAAAGLAIMRGQVTMQEDAAKQALSRARRPTPRLSEGITLAAAGARAMIDISDGLATDATHIGRASGVTLEIDLSLLPLHPGVAEAAAALKIPPWRLAVTGGEDYELCICAAPAERVKLERALATAGGAQITWVGEVLPAVDGVPGEPGARFTIDGQFLQMAGFEHRW